MKGRRSQGGRFGVQTTNIAVDHPAEPLYQGSDDLSDRHTDHGGPTKIVDAKHLISMVLLISKCPDVSCRAARHAYPRRSSIEPTTILLRKQKYRLIGIGPFTCRAIAGAPGRRA
jgi:hypothetical protein